MKPYLLGIDIGTSACKVAVFEKSGTVVAAANGDYPVYYPKEGWAEQKVLCEMGHSDRLVIADGNFPVESMGKNAITIRCDGHGVPEILDAILKLFPLDTYVEHPVNLMEVMPGDNVETPIWDTYKEIVSKHDERGEKAVGNIERFAFYDEAKTAYCIISTSEKALYANIMLQKGVVINND